MGLSFDDEESSKESIGGLNFNNSPSDSDSPQQVGSTSMALEERYEDISDNNPPSDSDPNIVILEVRRVPIGSSSSTGQERDEDICNDLPSDPDIILEVRR